MEIRDVRVVSLHTRDVPRVVFAAETEEKSTFSISG